MLHCTEALLVGQLTTVFPSLRQFKYVPKGQGKVYYLLHVFATIKQITVVYVEVFSV